MKKLFMCLLIFGTATLYGCNNESKPAGISKDSVHSSAVSAQVVKTILFLGNSLTAGYGVELAESFPSLIQQKIDSLNLPYRVINAGVSGETSAGGNARIDWILRQPVDVFVLELGAND